MKRTEPRHPLLLVVILVFSVQTAMSDLVAYFPLDGNLQNAAGGEDGYFAGSGSYVYTPGRVGPEALTLKGDVWINLDQSNTLTGNGSWSCTTWFRTTQTTVADVTTGMRLVSVYRDNVGVDTQFSMYLTIDSQVEVVCMVYAADGYHRLAYAPDLAPNDNNWHHLACTVDAKLRVVRMYLEGYFVAALGMDYALSGSGYARGQLATWAGGAGCWVASLDDVRLYNEVLDASHVYRVFQNVVAAIPVPTQRLAVLRAQYSFTNSSLVDATGLYSTATATGPVVYVADGAVGTAVRLSGGSCISVGPSSLLYPIIYPMTIATFFRTSQYPSGGSGSVSSWRLMAVYGSGQYSSSFSLALQVVSAFPYVTCVLGMSDGTFPVVSFPFYYADGFWHHAACTYNDTSLLLSLYVDGSLKVQQSMLQAADGVQAPAGTTAATLGCFGSTQEFYSGDLDEVYIYAAALTTLQVLNLTSLSSGAVKANNASSGSLWPQFNGVAMGSGLYVTLSQNTTALTSLEAFLANASALTISAVVVDTMCATDSAGANIAGMCVSGNQLPTSTTAAAASSAAGVRILFELHSFALPSTLATLFSSTSTIPALGYAMNISYVPPVMTAPPIIVVAPPGGITSHVGGGRLAPATILWVFVVVVATLV